MIGIIAILIALLLPSLGRARDTATMVKCLSNVRSIGQTTFMYQADNDDYYPHQIYRDGDGVWHHFDNTLGYYLPRAYETYRDVHRDKQVWFCPAQSDAPGFQAGDAVSWGMYVANAYFMGYPDGVTPPLGYRYSPYDSNTDRRNMRLSNVPTNLSQTAMIVDGYRPWQFPGQNNMQIARPNGSQHTAPHFSTLPINYGLPYIQPDLKNALNSTAFADGSAGNMKPTDFPPYFTDGWEGWVADR